MLNKFTPLKKKKTSLKIFLLITTKQGEKKNELAMPFYKILYIYVLNYSRQTRVGFPRLAHTWYSKSCSNTQCIKS